MAKQIGPLKFRGALDDVCGRQTEDGAILQAKPGPRRDQVLHHPRFKNTRRNASEFGGAIAASVLLRRVLGSMGKAVKHGKLVSYMNKKLHAVAMSDTESGWGDRHANKGNIHLLKGFDYNHLVGLHTALPVDLEQTLDATTGRMQVTVPDCLVRRKRVFPKAATHFRIVSCAGAVDFKKGKYSFNIATSELLPLGKVMERLQLENQISAQPGEVMLHTVGMVFYAVTDGVETMLRGGVLRIVEVARVQEAVQAQPAIVKDNTQTATPFAEQRTCAAVCIPAATPFVQVVVAKRMACAPCPLPETVSGIVLTVAEEEAICEIVADDISDVEADLVPADADDFSVGITDAKGVPLQGAVAVEGRAINQPHARKKMRLHG